MSSAVELGAGGPRQLGHPAAVWLGQDQGDASFNLLLMIHKKCSFDLEVVCG